MVRKALGSALCAGAALAFAASSAIHGQEPAFDLIIRGGRIVDGTGNPWFAGDVGISDGSHRRRRTLPGAKARRTIDATGLVVRPGFIDLHTHSDSRCSHDGTAAEQGASGRDARRHRREQSGGAARRAEGRAADGVRWTGRPSPSTLRASSVRASRST